MHSDNEDHTGYPRSYHGGERPRTTKRKYWAIAAILLAIVALILALIGLSVDKHNKAVGPAVAPVATTSWKTNDARVPYTAPPSGPRDFRKQDGTYRVGNGPGEIPAGLYTVTENPHAYVGYFALCNDLMCQPGAGIDVNVIVHGQDYLVVKPDTFAVQVRGLIVETA